MYGTCVIEHATLDEGKLSCETSVSSEVRADVVYIADITRTRRRALGGGPSRAVRRATDVEGKSPAHRPKRTSIQRDRPLHLRGLFPHAGQILILSVAIDAIVAAYGRSQSTADAGGRHGRHGINLQ